MMSDNSNERRSTPRSRCLKGARILLANGNSTLACRVRNRSETGFKLSTDETGCVPKCFVLIPDGDTRGHRCEVSWRNSTEVGAKVVAEAEVRREGYNRSNPLLRMRKPQIAERYPV